MSFMFMYIDNLPSSQHKQSKLASRKKQKYHFWPGERMFLGYTSEICRCQLETLTHPENQPLLMSRVKSIPFKRESHNQIKKINQNRNGTQDREGKR